MFFDYQIQQKICNKATVKARKSVVTLSCECEISMSETNALHAWDLPKTKSKNVYPNCADGLKDKLASRQRHDDAACHASSAVQCNCSVRSTPETNISSTDLHSEIGMGDTDDTSIYRDTKSIAILCRYFCRYYTCGKTFNTLFS